MPFAISRPKMTRLAIGASATVDQPLTPTRFNHGCAVEKLNTARGVALGTLATPVGRQVDNRRMVRPSGSFRPPVAEWGFLLPWLMYNAAPTGTTTLTFVPGNDPVERYVDVSFDQAQYFHMTGVGVSRATIEAESGGELTLDLDLVGRDYTNTGSYPTLSPNLGGPFLMGALAVQVGATSGVKTESFRLALDWGVLDDRYFNSQTVVGPVNGDRTFTVQLNLPLGLHYALWDAGAGDGGVAVTATFTRGASSLVFTMPAVVVPISPYEMDGSNPEVMLPWTGQACSSVSSNTFVPELTVAFTPGS